MMLRPELQAELTATREAMARLCAAVMRREGAPKVVGMTGETPAQRLQSFRAARGLSQRALAVRLEVSRAYIGDIETGRCEPSREFARKMAEVFGVSADQLLFGRGVA